MVINLIRFLKTSKAIIFYLIGDWMMKKLLTAVLSAAAISAPFVASADTTS